MTDDAIWIIHDRSHEDGRRHVPRQSIGWWDGIPTWHPAGFCPATRGWSAAPSSAMGTQDCSEG